MPISEVIRRKRKELEMTQEHLAQQGAPMGKASLEAIAYLKTGKDAT